MGYESRFYVVEKPEHRLKDSDGRQYAQVIAMFDYCKAGSRANVSIVADKSPDTELFIYAEDSNTRITEDSYGKPLKEIPLQDMIKALEHDGPNNYRRIGPFLALLNSLSKVEWHNVVVLRYGY